MGNWLKKNAFNVVLFAVIGGLLFNFLRDKSMPEIMQAVIAMVLVVVGLSFVIFIHELGHFLAAKWCGVRVHTFSIGFGPAIPGLRYKKGETEYKIAAFPLGGYVQMLGQDDPGVESKEGFTEDDPRSYKNKTVGQRMLIISAGVIMNVILGLFCFSYVYLTGKTEVAARIGVVVPGTPADIAGIQTGSELLQIDDDMKPTYESLFFAGAFSTPDVSEILFRWRTPSGEEKEAKVIPRKRDTDTKPVIGIDPPISNVLLRSGKPGISPAYANTPAADAAFLPGDTITLLGLPNTKPERAIRNGTDLAIAEFDFRGKPIEYTVSRKSSPQAVPILVQPRFIHHLGLQMAMGPIVTVGPDNPTVVGKLKEGDLILEVDGDKSFDPMRLADRMADKAGETVKLTVRRPNEAEPITVEVTPLKGRGTFDEEPPKGPRIPASVPSLGIAYTVGNVVQAVGKDTPADGKIRVGDTIQAITYRDSKEAKPETIPIEADQWPHFFYSLQMETYKTFDLKVLRANSKQSEAVTLTSVEDNTWPMANRGLKMEVETQLIYASSVPEAIQLGFRDTVRMIGRVYLNLKGLFTGMLSPKLVSGPIDIVSMTYSMAERGINDLILFLGMISVNLAVINFLPIPVLDGGHMVFLIWEKAVGKPASEKAQIVANMIGLALLASLMLFVIYLDISKRL